MSYNEPPQRPPLTSEDVQNLGKTVDQFGETIARPIRRRNGLLVALIVSLLFDLGLTFWLFRVQEHQTRNTHTIKTVQCSLYSLVLTAGYHPEKHDTTPDDLAEYNHVYSQIVRDNNELGCVPAVDPTRQTTTTEGKP